MKNAHPNELIISIKRDLQLFLKPDLSNVGPREDLHRVQHTVFLPQLRGGKKITQSFLENLETCLITNLQFPSLLHRGKNTLINE